MLTTVSKSHAAFMRCKWAMPPSVSKDDIIARWANRSPCCIVTKTTQDLRIVPMRPGPLSIDNMELVHKTIFQVWCPPLDGNALALKGESIGFSFELDSDQTLNALRSSQRLYRWEYPLAGLRPDPVLADGLERLRRALECFTEFSEAIPMVMPSSWAPPRPGPGGRPQTASPSFGMLYGVLRGYTDGSAL